MAKGASLAVLLSHDGGLFGVHVVGLCDDGKDTLTGGGTPGNLAYEPFCRGDFFGGWPTRWFVKHFIEANVVDDHSHIVAFLSQRTAFLPESTSGLLSGPLADFVNLDQLSRRFSAAFALPSMKSH
jgi:hypothetical protein